MTNGLKYRWILFWSVASLTAERLAKSFWPAFCLLAGYTSICLIGLPRTLGPNGHNTLFLAFLASGIFLCRRGLRQFRYPTTAETERKIEQQSNIQHRPLAAMHDTLTQDQGSFAQHLWQQHLKNMRSLLGNLRIYRGTTDLAARDPFAVRYAVLIMLFIGYVMGGVNAWQTARDNFFPDITTNISLFDIKADAWIVPPEYTHQAPVFLTASASTSSSAAVTVPEGSILKIRLHSSLPLFRASFGNEGITMASESGGNYTLDQPLHQSGTLKISYALRTMGEWGVTVTQDMPPELKLISTDNTPRSELKINFFAKDDYGFKKVTGTITPAPSITEDAPAASDEDSAPIVFEIPPPSPDKGENSFNIDLSWHLRAGFPAMIKLTAEDDLGHIVETEEKEIVIPERTFTNPTALRLISDRKKLVSLRDPISLRIIADDIFDVYTHPGYYKGDLTVFMALNVAARRLLSNKNPDDIRSVQQILWQVAMKLEDGGLSMAARELSDALQNLSRALDDKNTSQQQLDSLMAELQQKMQEYINTLASEMSQRLQQNRKNPTLSPELAEKFMKHIDIKKMIDQFREMMKGNPRDVMKKMSEYLKSMVDNIDLSKIDKMQKQQQEQMQALEDLQELVRKQQSLLDKSSKADPSDNGKEEAGEQSELRGKLGDIMRKLGEGMPEIPDNFGKADQSMKNAEQSMSSGHMKESIPHQQETLNQLQQGLDNAIQKMAEEMQQNMLTFGLMPGNSGYGGQFDPLGRDDGSASNGGDVKIPDERERRRIQEIIQELRSRANDQQRPKVERDYIDRLLDQLN